MSLEVRVLEVLKSLMSQSLIKEESIQGLHVTPLGKVSFSLEVKTEHLEEAMKLKEKAERLLKEIPGVTAVQIALTAQRKRAPVPQPIAGITHILAVASGKGGVGKSTTAVNLACALGAMNWKVGLLDGDIYGPSLPRLLGVSQKPTSDDGKRMNPIEVHGLKCMSMGFLLDEKSPAIWRGPMVQSAFGQMLRGVNWGELDVLVIDLPPGTGDVQLTLTQTVPMAGAVIVSTPQDLALIEARKALEMFRRMNVAILGLVENMSYFLCPHCEGRSHIFEHGGVDKEARALGVPLLAEIPLHPLIQETCAKGTPLMVASPTSDQALLYQSLASRVAEQLGTTLPLPLWERSGRRSG